MREPWLILAGCCSLAASIAHILIIIGGPAWYRFFGAGEPFALAAERGELWPAAVTFGIATVLAIWAAYAFSGAGMLPRLPLLRIALLAITVIYTLRGLVLFAPSMLGRPDLSQTFLTWSSVIVLGFAIVHGIGIWRAWERL